MNDENPIAPEGPSGEMLRTLECWRLTSDGSSPVRRPDQVITEEVLVIDIKEVGSYSLLHTPDDSVALAVGFAFCEGIISDLGDINLLHHCEDDPGVIEMQLADPTRAEATERNLIVGSSCGLCGSRDLLERFLTGISAVGESLQVPAGLLLRVVKQMQVQQRLFSQTGASHAAAIFSADGQMVALSEDIGRHNALDKTIGKCLLQRIPTVGCGVALSGRVSFELVAKAARAGLELIAAVSAPTSLAIDAAQGGNITLCGFVRADRATVYTHPWRIRDLEQ